MAELTKQTIASIIKGQDIHIDVLCYEDDGVTLRNMTGSTYKLYFLAKKTPTGKNFCKSSVDSEILLGTPSANYVRVICDQNDTAIPGLYHWKLYGTDSSDDAEFVAAYGTWEIKDWG